MINKQNLEVNNKIFNVSLDNPIELNGYSIKPYLHYIGLYNPEGKVMNADAPDYITEYASELLDVEFDSILVGGLGIGVIPYVCQDFAQVDVVEIDENIIYIAKQLGHLNENVNIIHDDILTFSVEKTYDIVVIDAFYEALTEELSNELIEKYMPFINEGGFLYIPINKGVIDDKVVINK
jgi:protein-L-isoaspartate O-methyltransferase